MSFHESSPTPAPQGTQAIGRALLLLEELQRRPSARLADLADAISLKRPTAHRLLAALVAAGYVRRRGTLYELGPKFAEAGSLAALRLGETSPKASPFYRRQVLANRSFQWRDWSGTLGPLSYDTTSDREYWAVRNGAAVIDVSPLFKIEIEGPEASAALQRIMTRDMRRCRIGQVFYSSWCNDDGQLLQDGNVIRLAEHHYRISAAHPTLRWFQDCCLDFDVEVRDRTDELAALAVQGPSSRRLLQEVLGDVDMDALRYFRAAAADFHGAEVLVTRTGFTGDLGYEVWMPTAVALPLWDALLEQGPRLAVLPAGLEALDRTRIEAGLVLIDVDFLSASRALLPSRVSTPYEVGLGWTVQLRDGNDFIGRSALEAEAQRGSRWAVLGVEVAWPELERVYGRFGLRPQSVGAPPQRSPTPLLRGGTRIGQVTSQCFSPLLKKQIGLATVASEWATPGTEVEIETMIEFERVELPARLAPLPFFDPERKRSRGGAA